MPMIRLAPAFLHPKTAARPTAPNPNTAHVLPASTWILNHEIILITFLLILLTMQLITFAVFKAAP